MSKHGKPERSGSANDPGDGAPATDQVNEPAGGRRGGRSAARRKLAGISVSLAIAIVAAAGVSAGSLAVPGTAAKALPVPTAVVPAGQSIGVCPAAAQLLDGAAAGSDPEFSPVSKTAKSTITALALSNGAGRFPRTLLAPLGAGSPHLTVAPGGNTAKGTTAKGAAADGITADGAGLRAAVARQDSAAAPTKLTAQPVDHQRATANGIMTYTAVDGDLRGLAAADCRRPGNDLWLVGASTAVGRTAVLHIYNPSKTPATIDLELYGDHGPIQAAGSRGLLVAPGKTESIVLAGLAANQQQLAVHLHSTGGLVSAGIQQSVLRQLTPGGVEFIAPTRAPANQQVITGVSIQDPALGRKIASQHGYRGAGPAVQIVVPGTADAVVELRVYGAHGQVSLPRGGVVTAVAGTATDVGLGALPRGTYTVEVSSDTAVAASVRLSRAHKAGEPVDLAVGSSGERLGTGHLVAIPKTVSSRLVFGAPKGAARVSIRAVSANGAVGPAHTVTVAAGHTVVVPAESLGKNVTGALISVSGEPVYGAQLLLTSKTPGIAVVSLPGNTQGQETIPVNLGF